MHLSYSFSTYKGKKYKSYAIAESYREGKKVKKRNIWPIGKLTESAGSANQADLKSRKEPRRNPNTIKAYCSQRQQSLSGYRCGQRVMELLAVGSGI